MLEKIKRALSRKKEEKPSRVARITFNSDLKIDHPLAKEIRLFKEGKRVGAVSFSDVMVRDLSESGWFIEDETQLDEIPVHSHWEGGRITLEDIDDS